MRCVTFKGGDRRCQHAQNKNDKKNRPKKFGRFSPYDFSLIHHLAVTAGLLGRLGSLLVLFFYPEAVMLFSPVSVNPASVHRINGTFHTDRADIDMRHDHHNHHY